LPITGSLALLYVSSLVIVLLLIAASLAGLLNPGQVYPTKALLESALPNDVINLAIGVPILLGSMWLTRRSRLVGLLFWPGALLYVLYNSLPRTFDMPLGWVFAANLVLVALSVYTSIALVARIDGAPVQQRLAGAVRARLSGAVLVVLGAFSVLRAAFMIVTALVDGTVLPDTELSVLVADALLGPVGVIGGVLLWRRKALGYVSGVGLLFQFSMLFVGLIGFLLLQPLLTSAPFDLEAVIVVSIMTVPCLVPFGLFLRGIIKSEA
jgi:hypothetical protein